MWFQKARARGDWTGTALCARLALWRSLQLALALSRFLGVALRSRRLVPFRHPWRQPLCSRVRQQPLCSHVLTTSCNVNVVIKTMEVVKLLHAVFPASAALITRIARAQVVLVKTGDSHGAARARVLHRGRTTIAGMGSCAASARLAAT